MLSGFFCARLWFPPAAVMSGCTRYRTQPPFRSASGRLRPICVQANILFVPTRASLFFSTFLLHHGFAH